MGPRELAEPRHGRSHARTDSLCDCVLDPGPPLDALLSPHFADEKTEAQRAEATYRW